LGIQTWVQIWAGLISLGRLGLVLVLCSCLDVWMSVGLDVWIIRLDALGGLESCLDCWQRDRKSS